MRSSFSESATGETSTALIDRGKERLCADRARVNETGGSAPELLIGAVFDGNAER